MKKKLSFCLLLLATTLLMSPHTLGDNHQQLEERVTALEESILQHNKTGLADVSFSGVIEVEASYTDADSAESTSDLIIATAALGVDALLTENLSATLALLYEEDDTDLEVDIATLSYSHNDSGLSLTVGQDYLPFGGYSTVLINDPLTLELGEIRESALVANYQRGQFFSAFYLFNGDQDEDGRDQLTNFGARVAFVDKNFSVGADYLSNLADSDSLQDNDYGYSAGADVVDGASIYGEFTMDSVQLMLEHLRALDELAVDGNNSEPQATHIEIAFAVDNFTYGIAYQETDEAVFLGLPEERISIGFSTEILSGLDLALELVRDDDYSVADGGTGDSANQLVVQFAAGF